MESEPSSVESDRVGEGLCALCAQIPLDTLFNTRQFDNGRQRVLFHSVDYIESEEPCSFCKLLLSMRCRLAADTWSWADHEKPKYLLCTFRPPRGMLSPLPDVVSTVIGIEKGNEREEGNLSNWCSSDWFPWPTSVFTELCLSGRVLEVKRHSWEGRGSAKYHKKDIEELRQFISKSSLLSKDEKTDERLCDIATGFRVIDCHTRRLVSPSFRGAYATLSYIWGSAAPAKSDNPFVLPTRAPPVIEDAIHLTKMLGLRYIWVDQFCIPQDDPRAKHSQISRMGDIYANSCLTIVAAAGDGPEYGLVGMSRPCPNLAPKAIYRIGPYSLTNVIATSPVQIVMPQTPVDVRGEIMGSKWNTRGWTYQEAILAKRRLVFTQSWLYFQDSRSEHQLRKEAWVFRQGFVEPLFRNPRVIPGICTNNIDALMHDHPHNYLQRDLTYDSDVYNAFRGIQSKLQEELSPKSFCYGLLVDKVGTRPRHIGGRMRSLTDALFWVMTGRPGSISRRPAAPSWTWLGWKLSRDGNAKGPLWQAPDLGMKSEVDIKLAYQDGFVTQWPDASTSQPYRLLGGEMPQLVIQGWTFGITRLVDKRTEVTSTIGADTSTAPDSLLYIGENSLDSLLKSSLQSIGVSDFAGALTSQGLVCLVLGWIVQYDIQSRKSLAKVYIMVLYSDDNGNTYERVNVLQALLGEPWDSSHKEDLDWIKRTVIIR